MKSSTIESIRGFASLQRRPTLRALKEAVSRPARKALIALLPITLTACPEGGDFLTDTSATASDSSHTDSGFSTTDDPYNETDTSGNDHCGDGVIQTQWGEECDEGYDNNDASLCTSECKIARCGDGLVGPGETCDDGNKIDDDGCQNDCKSATCGDGVVDQGEECDDGNVGSYDTCTANCTLPVCGDGLVSPGEQCDDKEKNGENHTCLEDCTFNTCGDGFLSPDEECDEGQDNNNESGECTSICTTPACGDGFLHETEACDDSNLEDGDFCSSSCELPVCGNGILEGGEGCDDGNTQNGDSCSATCEPPICGNSVIEEGEQCDDGNVENGDWCSEVCAIELAKTVRLEMSHLYFTGNGQTIGKANVHYVASATSSDGNEDTCSFVNKISSVGDYDNIPVNAICDIQVNDHQDAWIKFSFEAGSNGKKAKNSYTHYLNDVTQEWSGMGNHDLYGSDGNLKVNAYYKASEL